jgi:hypothetical protein
MGSPHKENIQMATRMQQRRGTAAQWTAANPILAAGEIGFETDTSKFKMGNGSSAWSALTYFANAAELSAIIDSAPEALNTLNELAAAIGDDANFVGTVTSHTSATTNVHGIANTAALATTAAMNSAIGAASTAVGTQAVADAAADATTKANAAQAAAIATAAADATAKANAAEEAAATSAGTAADAKIATHNLETENVHGIADTAELATKTYATDASTAAVTSAGTAADTKIETHNDETTGVHGIADTALLATKSYADDAETAAITAAGTAADGKVSTHNSATENVHGIADTADLVTQTDLTNAINGAEVDQSTLVGTGLSWNSVDTEFEIDETHITTATQTALDLKAPKADPTFTGTVSGVTKTHVGLGNVDNTSDANKPVSTATQTALNLKANLANPTFTGTVTSTGALVVEGNLTVSGTTTTVNAADLSITDPLIYLASNQYDADLLDVGFMAATGAPGGTEASHLHSGFFRDASDSKKWKLVSNVPHPVGNVVDVTNATRETLVVGALEATTVNASSGIVFSDGTQTKLGVPSVTTFATAISSSATLAAGEADKFVPLTGAVTITLPATGYSTGQSIDFYQASGTGAQFSNANSTVGTPGLKFRTTNSVVTAMKTPSGWLVFGDLSL